MLGGKKMWPERIKDDGSTRNPQEKVDALTATSERGPSGSSASKPVRLRARYKGLMLLQGLAQVLCCVIYSS